MPDAPSTKPHARKYAIVYAVPTEIRVQGMPLEIERTFKVWADSGEAAIKRLWLVRHVARDRVRAISVLVDGRRERIG